VVTDLDRSTVVMSIRPKYADAIMAATKRVEFRRRPLPGQVTTMLVYRSGPVSGRGLLGEVDVWACTRTTPAEIKARNARTGLPEWAIRDEHGVSAGELCTYADGWLADLWAIRLSPPRLFRERLALWEIGVDRAPQSWRYAPACWRDAVVAAQS
jgi:predicted transcriptional regulator